MTLKEFKKLHTKFNDNPMSVEILNSTDYEEYIDLIHENKEFHNYVLQTNLESKGFDYTDFCCLVMANHICDSFDENNELKQNDHDVIMNKWIDGTYGIPIHDGGNAVIKINYCPWCGSNLEKDE